MKRQFSKLKTFILQFNSKVQRDVKAQREENKRLQALLLQCYDETEGTEKYTSERQKKVTGRNEDIEFQNKFEKTA